MKPILIVGAGPVGLTMALELARFGLGVRLIDRSPHATETSKAIVIWSRTLELMDRVGCVPAFLEAGVRVSRASIRSGGTLLGSPQLDGIASAYNFALMIPQRDTERLLSAQLEPLGVTVERQVELVSFTEAADHVAARLKHADGGEETVETPWLIGCDGAHSTVRHQLGATFEGSAQGDDWMLADVRLDGAGKPPPDEIAIYLHRDGPFVIFPIPGGRARVITVTGKSDPAHPRPDPTLGDVQAFVDQRAGGGFKVIDPVWLANFRINERKVAAYSRGRVFLAGDAAHIHSPAGGQGMNTGMQDAFNLAWKLAMVAHGEAAASLLDSYSPERTAVGKMVLRNAGRMTDVVTLANPAAQVARNLLVRFMLGFHGVRDRVAATLSEIEIAYADSPLSRGPHAGARWSPQQYGGPAPGVGRAPRFVLYAADTQRGAALTARFSTLLEPEARTPPAGSGLFVIRPDGYVGFAGGADAWGEAGRYLGDLARSAGDVTA